MDTSLPSPALLLLALATAACSSSFGTGTSGDSGTAGTVGDDEDGTFVPGAEDLPRVDQDLDTGGCEELYEEALPGAVSYFFGTYARDADGWAGEEELRIFANGTWASTGGEDCSVFWVVSASEDDPGACGNCDVGLSVSAELDLARTTCGQTLTKGEESFFETYGIDITDGGSSARWYFAESGDQFGTGHAVTVDGSPKAVNYASEKTCWWF